MTMILVKKVRISFPHLFTKPVINGEEGKFGGTLMFDPETHSDTIGLIQKGIASIQTEKFKGRKLPADKLCLREGEDKGRPEYDGLVVLSANNPKRPVVLDAQRNAIQDESACKIYAGCYVNAKIQLWAQDNKYGKRINATLIAVQFAGDGEPLDGQYIAPEVAMEGFDEEEFDEAAGW